MIVLSLSFFVKKKKKKSEESKTKTKTGLLYIPPTLIKLGLNIIHKSKHYSL